HDVTEAVRLEREVAAQAARLQAVVDLVDEGIAVFDPDNRLVFVNDAGRRRLGFSDGMPLEERAGRQPLLDADGRPLAPGAPPPARVSSVTSFHVTSTASTLPSGRWSGCALVRRWRRGAPGRSTIIGTSVRRSPRRPRA